MYRSICSSGIEFGMSSLFVYVCVCVCVLLETYLARGFRMSRSNNVFSVF